MYQYSVLNKLIDHITNLFFSLKNQHPPYIVCLQLLHTSIHNMSTWLTYLMQERQLVQKIRMTTLQIHWLHRRVLSLYNCSLHCLTYLSLPKLGNFVNFRKFRQTFAHAWNLRSTPSLIWKCWLFLEIVSLMGILSQKREWLWEPKDCEICLVTAMNKIDWQLHFCVYCWFTDIYKLYLAFKTCKENNWNINKQA